jgi:hypothetical protein
MRVKLKGSRSGSLLVVGEIQSRRDPTKVAQHEVLGNEANRHVSPGHPKPLC